MSESHVDHVRLNTSGREELLNTLDERSGDNSRTSEDTRREAKRFVYRHEKIPVTINHPGGTAAQVMGTTRNLSAGGVGFLHGGFVHPGTEVTITLTRLDDMEVSVRGVVASCRHAQGTVHEIGVAFDRKIEPRLFMRESASRQTRDATGELADLNGRIVYLEDSPLDQRLMEFNLRSSPLELIMKDTVDDAVAATIETDTDVVISDLNLKDGETGIEAIVNLRCSGFQGPIILLTAEENGDQIVKAREAGANHIMNKPVNTGELASILGELLASGEPTTEADLLYSSLEEQEGMKEMICEYIEQMNNAAKDLRSAVRDSELADVRKICMMIKGSARGYGFASLGDIAGETLSSVDASVSLDEANASLKKLETMCRSLSVGRPGV